MNDSPQFLIPWSSPWRDFLSSLGPALRPSPPRLHVEARAGLFPARGILFVFALEAAALASVIALHSHVLSPETQPSAQLHDIIYFSADELPRTEDLAGGSAGRHGARGGTSLEHPSQTIKVARGEKLEARVVDAPALHLPESDSQIANLLAYKAAVPDPPPSKPAATPIIVRSSRERQRKQPEIQPAAPKVTLSTNTMPDLPHASVTPIAPPPVAAPLKVSRERVKLTLPVAAAPKMPVAREQMPTLPEAEVSVKAPPTPIQVARSRHKTVRSAEAAPPTLDVHSQIEHMASIVSASAPSLPAAPPQPTAPAESKTVAVIVSANPGAKAAVPKEQEKNTVAMARGGSSALGSGGTGGGTGMEPGKAPGSSASGSNAGATNVGNDKGTDYYARNGNSPNLGPGGTGNMSSGTPRAPGVSVSGGKTSITLPSFGGPPANSGAAGRSEIAKNMGNGITVIASPRAGGALNLYGALKGDRVYTIYINTRLGTAVMQFADPNSVGHAYATELSPPRVVLADIKSDAAAGHLPRVLISCELDERGVVKNAHVLQSENSDFAAQILASLPAWKFTAAFRGNQPVAVNAILGFGVDTK